MKLPQLSLLLVCALPLHSMTMEELLSRMDRAAAAFHSVRADLNQVAHTAVINQDDVETGVLSVKRPKPHELRMLANLTAPDPKMVALEGQKLSIFLPKINTVQVYDLGKNRALLEQFLLLGFGATRADLSTAYDIQWKGEDEVEGARTGHLLLTPKTKDVLQRVQSIDLWLDETTAYPTRHRIHLPGGDYQQFTFTKLQINPELSDSALRLKTPKGVKVEYPGR